MAFPRDATRLMRCTTECDKGLLDRRTARKPNEARLTIRLKRLLQSSLGQPNHPFFAFFVIALVPTSLLFDLLSYVISGESFSKAALYTMIVGLLGAVLAIPTGLAQYVDIDRRVPARRVATVHMWLNFLVTALLLTNVLWRRALPAAPRTHPGPMLLSLVVVAVLMRSGHLGGKLVYSYGIGLRKKAN